MTPTEATLLSDTEVMVTRRFDASAALLWRTYTEAPLLRRWCGVQPGWTMPVCDMDVRVGGAYRWQWESEARDVAFGFYGEFVEVVPHERLVHTQQFDAGTMGVSMGGEPSIVTVTFQENDRTTLVTTVIRYASQSDRDEAMSTGMTEGMELNYGHLDRVLTQL